jgi:hypothetical protein
VPFCSMHQIPYERSGDQCGIGIALTNRGDGIVEVLNRGQGGLPLDELHESTALGPAFGAADHVHFAQFAVDAEHLVKVLLNHRFREHADEELVVAIDLGFRKADLEWVHCLNIALSK